MGGLVTSTFKVGPAGCGGRGGWVLSGFSGGWGGLSGIFGSFPTTFVLYLND